MNRRPRNGPLLAAFLLALSGLVLAAEGGSMRDIGDYTVHYNAMHASALDPSVAERYGLPRSDKRCVVTVAVTEDSSGDMVGAHIMGSATRPDGRMYKLEMRAIEDVSGMYYIGELPLDVPGTLHVRLEIQPSPDMPPQTIRFTRDLSAP